MKTYWDYTEKERSELTEENVKALLDTELMTKGVLKVEAPELKEIKPIELAKVKMFEVDNILFDTADLAEKFLALKPKKSTYGWSYGDGAKYPVPIGQKIEQVEMANEQDVLAAKSVLEENNRAKDYNEKATGEYDEARKAQDKVLADVWDDWYVCRKTARTHAETLKTLAEYEKHTNGDKAMARTFILKVVSAEDLKAAEAWFELKGE